eukprot:s936_g14.t1
MVRMAYQIIILSYHIPVWCLSCTAQLSKPSHGLFLCHLHDAEFGNAMERFKVMEANNEASGTTVTAAPCSLAAAPPAVQQAFIVQMPILMPMMQMVPNVSILSQPIMSAVEAKSDLVDVPDVASQSTMDDEDTISELSIEWQRANTLGSAHLPVERTFIQFDTRMHVRHRRSRSV